MISENDKVRCRAHLGYIGAQAQSTFVLGVPAGVQTQFVIESAFNKILPSSESLFRDYLDRLDLIEEQIVGDTENLAVDSIDEIKLRADEFKQLIIRYRHWQGAISNMLGVTPNPFDQRAYLGAGWNGASGINVAVQH